MGADGLNGFRVSARQCALVVSKFRGLEGSLLWRAAPRSDPDQCLSVCINLETAVRTGHRGRGEPEGEHGEVFGNITPRVGTLTPEVNRATNHILSELSGLSVLSCLASESSVSNC